MYKYNINIIMIKKISKKEDLVLFENTEVRKAWFKEKWYFSVSLEF